LAKGELTPDANLTTSRKVGFLKMANQILLSMQEITSRLKLYHQQRLEELINPLLSDTEAREERLEIGSLMADIAVTMGLNYDQVHDVVGRDVFKTLGLDNQTTFDRLSTQALFDALQTTLQTVNHLPGDCKNNN